ncbi:MAG: Fic family protein [Actinomycetota bacterium]|jgi:Fic family protein|nr:Fic family protein [Actinomycetota bacterium]
MVRRPEPAPEASAPPAELFETPVFPQLIELFRKANRKYLYWDKFKQQLMPDGVEPADAWRLLKLARGMNKRIVPIQDVSDEWFSYARTEELERVLHVIDQQAGGNVTTSVSGLPKAVKQRYIISSLMEEAIASSQIEGAATTRRNAKDMLRAKRPANDRSEQMILNNYKTISKIKELKAEPLTPKLIVDLQGLLTKDALDDPGDCGRFRSEDDDIVIVSGGAGTNQVLHAPPPASEIEAEMIRLCAYANDDDSDFEHPVLKAIILHFWLAYLHPFADGNGRTARALFYLCMLKKGYWLFEYLSISRVIKNRDAHYYRAFLYSEIDDADLTYFITFNLHAIEQSLSELWDYLERKSQEDNTIRSRLERESSLNRRQRAILMRALREPDTEFTIESHQTSHDVSYASSRNDLRELETKGYLVRSKRGREYVYQPADDIASKLDD